MLTLSSAEDPCSSMASFLAHTGQGSTAASSSKSGPPAVQSKGLKPGVLFASSQISIVVQRWWRHGCQWLMVWIHIAMVVRGMNAV